MLIKTDGLLCSYYSETCTVCNLKWRHYVMDGEGLGKTPGMMLDRSKTRIPSSQKQSVYLLVYTTHLSRHQGRQYSRIQLSRIIMDHCFSLHFVSMRNTNLVLLQEGSAGRTAADCSHRALNNILVIRYSWAGILTQQPSEQQSWKGCGRQHQGRRCIES